jgi:hypothetical protein
VSCLQLPEKWESISISRDAAARNRYRNLYWRRPPFPHRYLIRKRPLFINDPSGPPYGFIYYFFCVRRKRVLTRFGNPRPSAAFVSITGLSVRCHSDISQNKPPPGIVFSNLEINLVHLQRPERTLWAKRANISSSFLNLIPTRFRRALALHSEIIITHPGPSDHSELRFKNKGVAAVKKCGRR